MRETLNNGVTERTTIVTSKMLMDKAVIRARENSESLSDFINRALVNQLEKEGDINVRQEFYGVWWQ